MKNCIKFKGNSGGETNIMFLTLSPVLLDSKKRLNPRRTVTCVTTKLTDIITGPLHLFFAKTVAEFLQNKLSAHNKQTASWADLTSNEKAIGLFDDKTGIGILALSLPKEDITQIFSLNKNEVRGENSATVCSRPVAWNAIVSETLHSMISSPENEVNLRTLCLSMFKLRLNSSDSLLSPVGIGKSLTIKGSIPEGSGKGSVADSMSLMFVVLGWNGEEPARSIEIFDGNTRKWSFFERECPFMRAYHGVALLGGNLYMIGGFNGHTCLPTTVCLNVRSRDWSRKSNMSMPRCYVLTLVYHDEIYAIGGHNGERRLKTCEKFDPKRNRWSPISDMMYRRSDAAGAELNGKILVCGGFDGFHINSTTEIYDPATDQWTLLVRLLHPRSGHCMVNFDGYLFVLGGFDGLERLREVERFNEETNQWERSIPMLEGRSNFCAAVFHEEVYAIGGYDGNKTMTSVEKFDKTLMEWQRASCLNLDRSAAGACVLNNTGSVTACELNELVPVASTYTEESSP